MEQQTLFQEEEEEKTKTSTGRPRITVFRLKELLEETPPSSVAPKRRWTNLMSILDKLGQNIRGTWAAPLLGLVVYTIIIWCSIIAVFCLIGGIFAAAGIIIGGIINLALNYPVLFFILLCLVGAVYLIAVFSREKSTEAKPAVEDNTGLFD